MSADLFKFHYRLEGTADQPTLLFLHGFMGDLTECDSISALLGSGFRYLKIDLPGHGRTTNQASDADFSIESTAEGIISLLDNLKIDICHMAGYSMGGRLALYLVVTYPDRFSRVVLESASPGLRSETERAQRAAHDDDLARQLKRTPFGEFLDAWYRQPVFASLQSDKTKLQEAINRRAGNDPAGLATSLRGMGTGIQPSLWDRLPDLSLPICLLVGELDTKFCGIANEMAALCPHMTVKIVSGAGHNVHMEQPQIYAEIIRKFLTENK